MMETEWTPHDATPNNATPTRNPAPPSRLEASLKDGRLPGIPLRLWTDTALPYRSGQRDGVCRLRLFVPAAGPVTVSSPALALVTELPEIEGLSMTNGIEVIAAEVCRKYGLSPRQTILIEHYDDRGRGYSARLPGRVDGEKFCCVLFERMQAVEGEQGAFRLKRPEWRRLSKEKVEALIGAPLP